MANTIAGISYIPSFPQFRLFSTYACALSLLQSAILKHRQDGGHSSEAMATAN